MSTPWETMPPEAEETDAHVAGTARVQEQMTIRGVLDALRQRYRGGDLGTLPTIIALIVVWAVFFQLNERFISPLNITNLMLQIAAMGTIAVGVVLILLLAEIDLSVAAVSGFAASVMGVLSVKQGWPGLVAIGAALVVGLLIGLFNGLWVTRFGVPSFVVTLAGLLAWQGALLQTLGRTGTVNINDPSITWLAFRFLPPAAGWAVAVIAVVTYAAAQLLTRRRRKVEGLGVQATWMLVARITLVAVLILGFVAFLNRDRGLPVALLLLLGLVVLFSVIVRRTRFGRHILAVGGNVEAARRAGISVSGIRLAVFAIASTLAALGGVVAAARLLAVNQNSGGGDLLLNSIAAAVIGGTSLFGGRGTVWAAFLGALVIGSISNGMDLLGYVSSIKYMVTGGVLLLAVTVDALSRRSRRAHGLA
jgi:D-xylose transport system permease protein